MRSLAERYFPTVHRNLARQNSEKRGFARSVGTDQADAISIGNCERNILEERVRSEGFRDFLCVDNGRQ
jgi:hypothetical protein